MDIGAIVAAAGVVESAVANTERSASCKRIRSDLRPLLRAGRARRRRCWRPAAALAWSEIVHGRIRRVSADDDSVFRTRQACIRNVTGGGAGNGIRHADHHRAGKIDDGLAGRRVCGVRRALAVGEGVSDRVASQSRLPAIRQVASCHPGAYQQAARSRRRCWRRCSAWQTHIVHVHPGEVAEAIFMYQELDAHGLPRIRRHVHRLLGPGLRISTLMEDRLEDGAGGIGDVSILPIESNAVDGAVPVPEAQRAAASRYRELLIEGAVSSCLAREAAKAIGCVARESGKSPAVRLVGADHRRRVVAVNYPVREVSGLESAVKDYFTDASGPGDDFTDL